MNGFLSLTFVRGRGSASIGLTALLAKTRGHSVDVFCRKAW